MKRITDIKVIKHADGGFHKQLYCFGHLWGPAYFKQGSEDYTEYLWIVQRLKAYEDTGLTPEEITSFINDQRNFEVWASDNTDYTLTCKDGIYSVADKYGHIVCEFIR